MSEQEVIVKAMMGSLEQLKVKVSCLQNEINLVQKCNEEVMDSYDKEKTVVRRRVERVAKSVSTSFVGMVMCMSRTKWCTEIFW